MRSQVCDTWHSRLCPLPDTWGTFTVISFSSTLPSDLKTTTCVTANGINGLPGIEENKLIQRKLTGRTFYMFRLCLELQIFKRKNLSENWIWQQPYRVQVRFCLAIHCFSYSCLQEFIAVMKCKTHLYWALWFQQVEENISSSESVASCYSLLKHMPQLL